MRSRIILMLAGLDLLLAPLTASAVTAPASRCLSAQLLASARMVRAQLACFSSAARTGEQASALCLTKARARFLGDLAKASTAAALAGGSCVFGEQTTSLAMLLEAFAGDQVRNFSAGDGASCRSRVLRAAGAVTNVELRLGAAAFGDRLGRHPGQGLQKARAKLAKASACLSVPGAAQVEAASSAFIGQIILRLAGCTALLPGEFEAIAAADASIVVQQQDAARRGFSTVAEAWRCDELDSRPALYVVSFANGAGEIAVLSHQVRDDHLLFASTFLDVAQGQATILRGNAGLRFTVVDDAITAVDPVLSGASPVAAAASAPVLARDMTCVTAIDSYVRCVASELLRRTRELGSKVDSCLSSAEILRAVVGGEAALLLRTPWTAALGALLVAHELRECVKLEEPGGDVCSGGLLPTERVDCDDGLSCTTADRCRADRCLGDVPSTDPCVSTSVCRLCDPNAEPGGVPSDGCERLAADGTDCGGCALDDPYCCRARSHCTAAGTCELGESALCRACPIGFCGEGGECQQCDAAGCDDVQGCLVCGDGRCEGTEGSVTAAACCASDCGVACAAPTSTPTATATPTPTATCPPGEVTQWRVKASQIECFVPVCGPCCPTEIILTAEPQGVVSGTHWYCGECAADQIVLSNGSLLHEPRGSVWSFSPGTVQIVRECIVP